MTATQPDRSGACFAPVRVVDPSSCGTSLPVPAIQPDGMEALRPAKFSTPQSPEGAPND